MRKDFGVKPIICPMPVLIVSAYDENGKVNLMNAAWGTACDTNKVLISLAKDHKTTENILKTGEFTVAMATESEVVSADFVGVVSGYDCPDKFEKTGWTASKSKKVNAPIVDQLPLALECKLVSYNDESEILIGEIVGVSVDESILEGDKVALSKFKPICYDPLNHDYVALGAKAGTAFLDGKKLKN